MECMLKLVTISKYVHKKCHLETPQAAVIQCSDAVLGMHSVQPYAHI